MGGVSRHHISEQRGWCSMTPRLNINWQPSRHHFYTYSILLFVSVLIIFPMTSVRYTLSSAGCFSSFIPSETLSIGQGSYTRAGQLAATAWESDNTACWTKSLPRSVVQIKSQHAGFYLILCQELFCFCFFLKYRKIIWKVNYSALNEPRQSLEAG